MTYDEAISYRAAYTDSYTPDEHDGVEFTATVSADEIHWDLGGWLQKRRRPIPLGCGIAPEPPVDLHAIVGPVAYDPTERPDAGISFDGWDSVGGYCAADKIDTLLAAFAVGGIPFRRADAMAALAQSRRNAREWEADWAAAQASVGGIADCTGAVAAGAAMRVIRAAR